jgi:ferredoxin
VFESDDDGRGTVIAETVPLVYQESARLGSDNCPEDAITVIDD